MEAVVDEVIDGPARGCRSSAKEIEDDRAEMSKRFIDVQGARLGRSRQRGWFISAGAIPLAVGLALS